MTTDDEITRIARETRVIALVGMSPNPDRPSWGVMRYLQSQGFRVIPVNPAHAGEQLLGETVYADLHSIPEATAIDMVDIFRRSEAVSGVVDDALAALPALKTVWMQLGAAHPEAAAKA
ncbi:MAG: CoA-binding protein, partial [Paracoccus sp. (in: a-proteobacteria)]|nr:CoA-binding protein [Paracoccus sp. (in: a-proteobacteria)]